MFLTYYFSEKDKPIVLDKQTILPNTSIDLLSLKNRGTEHHDMTHSVITTAYNNIQ